MSPNRIAFYRPRAVELAAKNMSRGDIAFALCLIPAHVDKLLAPEDPPKRRRRRAMDLYALARRERVRVLISTEGLSTAQVSDLMREEGWQAGYTAVYEDAADLREDGLL